jgi:hypothetical protein
LTPAGTVHDCAAPVWLKTTSPLGGGSAAAGSALSEVANRPSAAERAVIREPRARPLDAPLRLPSARQKTVNRRDIKSPPIRTTASVSASEATT